MHRTSNNTGRGLTEGATAPCVQGHEGSVCSKLSFYSFFTKIRILPSFLQVFAKKMPFYLVMDGIQCGCGGLDTFFGALYN